MVWGTTDVHSIAYLPFGFEAKVFKGADEAIDIRKQ